MKTWSQFWNPPYDLENERQLFRRILILSLGLHLLTAWFSIGYQSADEQFQILEFLAYKLGWAPAYDLPVEFRERMRPWLQPAIYYGFARFWEALGITDSHFWAFTFRCFSGLVGWLSGVAMALCARDWFSGPRARRLVLWCAGLLWFLPALHARPSSESLAGSAFTIGVCLLSWAHLKKGPDLGMLRAKWQGTEWTPTRLNWLWILGGAFWGFAFESRYQLALMAVGGWLWFAAFSLSRGRQSVRELVLILVGFGTVFALGRVADRWGFGDWSFSPWNYVNYNLIRGEVSRFGQEPWWEIFRVSVMESWPILGLLFALLIIVAWVRHPRHVLTWCHLPFFLVHELIQHKEYRFFYPIGAAGPVMIALALTSAQSATQGGELDRWVIAPLRGAWNAVRRYLFRALIALNTIALITLAFIPFARTVQYQQAVYREFRKEAAHTPATELRAGLELFTPGRDPFRILGNPIYFYRPEHLVVKPYASPEDLVSQVRSRLQQPGRTLPVWIFEPSFELPNAIRLELPQCQVIFRTLPPWLSPLRESGIGAGIWERINVFTLYRCTP